MNRIYIFLFLLMLSSCGDEPNTKASTPVSDEKTVTKGSSTVAEDHVPASNIPETKDQPTEANGAGLNLWVSDGEVVPGGDVCVQISASGVKDVISMQYSMRWDPTVLTFKEIKGFNLSSLDKNDFGLNRVDKGILTAVWIEDNLSGVNLERKTPIYQLCFAADGDVGAESAVRFWSTPTPFESVVLPEQVIPISTHKGMVVVRGK